MKLPDINQSPREYHENLRNVVKFIEESVVRIESLNKKIEGCEMIDIEGRKYLNETEVKELIKVFAKSKDFDSLESTVAKASESLEILSKDVENIKLVKQLSVSDVKAELEPYELTKDVNAKIKSCRDTMGENYDNYTKGLDSKLTALTSDISGFKDGQVSAYNKLKDDTEKKIKSESERIEKSILKKVLDKISKLMG